MHSTAQYSVQRKSIPDWQLWILAVVILIGCWYSDRSIKCACSWPTSRQWMESKEPEALTTIQPSNIKRPAMSNAFPCITATEPTNQWNGLQRCLSCMCGTAAEIWGTFFFPVGINWFPSTSQDFETLKKLFLRRTGALPDYTFQLTEKQQAVIQDRSAVLLKY